MSNPATDQQSESSAEQIAYRLMDNICKAEGRAWLPAALGRGPVADREYTLSLYAACLDAVRGKGVAPNGTDLGELAPA